MAYQIASGKFLPKGKRFDQIDDLQWADLPSLNLIEQLRLLVSRCVEEQRKMREW